MIAAPDRYHAAEATLVVEEEPELIGLQRAPPGQLGVDLTVHPALEPLGPEAQAQLVAYRVFGAVGDEVAAAQTLLGPIISAPDRYDHAITVLGDSDDLAATLHPAAAPFAGFDHGRLDDVPPAVEDLRIGTGNVVDLDRRRQSAVHEEAHQPDRVGAPRDGVGQADGSQDFVLSNPEVVGPGIRLSFGPLLQNQAIDPVVAPVAKIVSLGIVPGRPFDPASQPSAVQEAIARVMRHLKATGSRVDGWIFTTDGGDYGKDYLQRFLVTTVGLGCNLPQNAVYYLTTIDAAGRKLNGASKYVMRLPAGELPPVDAFRPLTMYDADYFLVENPFNRYSVSPRDDLKADPDGSVNLSIQTKIPGAMRELKQRRRPNFATGG